MLGFNPLYFSGAVTTTGVMNVLNDQRPLWPQYEWQAAAQFSRESLARIIAKAEQDIARLIGYWPAPNYVSGEHHVYDGDYLQLDRGKLIVGGRRATTLIGTVAPVFSDPDGDSFNELATITAPTTLTDACQIKLFFTGNTGQRQWEVRPIKTIEITGGNVVITLDSWLLIKPELWNRLPNNASISGIVANDTDSYVTSVEVRREFTDPASASVEFYWNCGRCGGSGCGPLCEAEMAQGCFATYDAEQGLIAPFIATYDADSESWTECNSCGAGRRADYVRVWYLSGLQENLSLEGVQCTQLSYDMAYLVSILAASRIEFFKGSNNNVQALVDYWRRDLTESSQGSSQFFVPVEYARNSLGTRRGEVEVFRTLSQLRDRVMSVASAR